MILVVTDKATGLRARIVMDQIVSYWPVNESESMGTWVQTVNDGEGQVPWLVVESVDAIDAAFDGSNEYEWRKF